MKKDITTRADIELLLNSFYGRAQHDPVIGYIFTDVVKINWEEHLPRAYDFLETVFFGKNLYKGNPLEKHFQLNEIHPLNHKHFDRWKEIFFTVADELFEGPSTELIKQKSANIADTMIKKINAH